MSDPSQRLRHAFANKVFLPLSPPLHTWVECIANNAFKQKGVFTVLVTLLVYKCLHPEQDVRCHQTKLPNGFSGRTIDTLYITPTLKALGLPAMAESGWLTRSLEQPYPYTLQYFGVICGIGFNEAFLNILNTVENTPELSDSILRHLLTLTWQTVEANQIPLVVPAFNQEFSITQIIDFLEQQFTHNYHVAGGNKLPVLAFYSLYQCLLTELARYQGCTLPPVTKSTASDRTSKTAGDIEIFKQDAVFEVREIKLNRWIDAHLLRIVVDKIKRHAPQRYYVLSDKGVKLEDTEAIQRLVDEAKETYGCPIVVNGVLPTLKYYLRLLLDNKVFLKQYFKAIEEDTDLKKEHKVLTNTLINQYFSQEVN